MTAKHLAKPRLTNVHGACGCRRRQEVDAAVAEIVAAAGGRPEGDWPS